MKYIYIKNNELNKFRIELENKNFLLKNERKKFRDINGEGCPYEPLDLTDPDR